jgi:hypothetical protein
MFAQLMQISLMPSKIYVTASPQTEFRLCQFHQRNADEQFVLPRELVKD